MGNRPLRVAMIGDYPRDPSTVAGGVESVMLYLCEKLADKDGLELHVVTLDRWGLGERTELYGGARVHYVAASALRGPLSRIDTRRRLAAKLRELAPDLVHAHIAGQYSAAAQMTRRPYLLTLHGIRFLEANLRPGLVDRIYRRHVVRSEEIRSVRSAKYLVSINPFIDQTFGEAIRGEVAHIENPVADVWFTVGAPPSSRRLLYVGRLTPRKDILTLLRAFRATKEALPDVQLRLAGGADSDGRYLEEIQSFIHAHGLERGVTLLGNLDETALLREYERCSLLVMASVLETAPMSIAQSLAAGRAVVCTDAGGCRYMIDEGITGRVVPCHDPEALARAVIASSQEPARAQRMGQAARDAANGRFRADTVADATLALYRRITDHGA